MAAERASESSLPISELTLDEVIQQRHSTRQFLPTPIPKVLVTTALKLAQLAPSNSNIQPWHLVLVSGPRLQRLNAALQAEASISTPKIPPLPDSFNHFRSELGAEVFGVGMGIARGDKEARRAAVLHNYDFFGAPLAGILCMDRRLGSADSLSVGM
jgi:nitroreductase